MFIYSRCIFVIGAVCVCLQRPMVQTGAVMETKWPLQNLFLIWIYEMCKRSVEGEWGRGHPHVSFDRRIFRRKKNGHGLEALTLGQLSAIAPSRLNRDQIIKMIWKCSKKTFTFFARRKPWKMGVERPTRRGFRDLLVESVNETIQLLNPEKMRKYRKKRTL